VFSFRAVQRGYKEDNWGKQVNPCGGRVQYLHRDPAGRRRRRKGKSQIWDSKIWSRVPKDSDPRKIVLARASSIYKRQTRPLVREGAPQKQDRNCQTNKYLVMSPRGDSTPRLTDWLTDRESQCDFTLTLTTKSVLYGSLWGKDAVGRQAPLRKGFSALSWRISTVRSRCQGAAGEDTVGSKRLIGCCGD
jgi:hypothetical protein